ncbi:MAG: DUF5011 domain-containing protein [Alteromonadaceae bacterium]|nr:DUF5011 domain-containing protein [Alteromonadaceae bacterium]
MRKIIIFIFLCISVQYVNAEVQINIDANNVSHTVHPMLQGHGLVYSEEDDSIYSDGSMAQIYQDVGASFLRWPGGTVVTMYHWNDLSGVGWIDKWDPTWDNANNRDASEYMDLDEYITLSKAAGTEPMLGINLSSGIEWDRREEGIQEAIDMIEYCLSQDFNVKYFYLDNENSHHGNGYNKDPDGDGEEWTAQSYAQEINTYAAAIKTLVPDAKIIANWTDKVRSSSSNFTTIMNVAGDNIDYIDVHWYWKWGDSSWDLWKAKTPMENETSYYDGGTFVEEMQYFNNLAASLGKSHIKLASLEWNIAPGDHNTNPDHTPFMTALMASEMQMQFIQGGLELASMWTTQWAGSSTSEFQALVDSDNNYAPSPMAKVFELYKHGLNGDLVSSSSDDNKIMTATIIKGDKAYVYLLNKKDNNENAKFSLNGYDIVSVGQAKRFADPGTLTDITLWNDANGDYVATIKANSLTMVEFNIDKYVPPAGTNLVVNGDFEQGLANWGTWNNPTVSNDEFEGTSAIKLYNKASINQWVSVEASTTYTLSAYAKIDNSSKRVVLGVNDSNNDGIVTVDIYDSQYTLNQFSFTTDANTTSVKVYFWLPPSDNASAFVDAISLIKQVPSIDTTAPVISLIGGASMSVVQYSSFTDPGATAIDYVDGDISASVQISSNLDTNTVGAYTVTYSVSDAAGNLASTTRNVTVTAYVDTVAPVITLVGASSVTLELGDVYMEVGATASDNDDGDVTANITISGTVDSSTTGTYTITYSVADAAGNAATATRTVTVVDEYFDTVAPVITLNGASAVTLEFGNAYVEAGATATDNDDGDVTANITITGSVDSSTAGTYTITYSVADAAGNAASLTRIVTVEEYVHPTIINLALPGNGGSLDSFTGEYSSQWGAAKLTNGVTVEDGWASKVNPDTQEFIYSFTNGDSVTLSDAVIHSGTAEGQYWAKNVEVWTSVDGSNYTLAASGSLANNSGSSITLDLSGIVAKNVKLVVTSGYRTDYWEIGEFELNGW